MSLSNDLKKFILSKGAKQVGFADLNDMGVSNINGEDLGFKVKSGICFLINLDANIVKTLLDGPSLEYYNHYSKINDELDSIGKDVEAFLKSKNYNAYAQTFDRTCNDFIFNNGCDNTIPHKTVGTKAGLGWIGKCDAFITNEFGSALRLSTVLTDAPLEYAHPVTASLCGMCTECRNICPGGAVSVITWSPRLKREDFFDYEKCMEAAKKQCREVLGREDTICGRCIAACPHTQKYLRKVL